MNIKGKNILFIGPSFYNYENEIILELTKQGANVTYYQEKENGFIHKIADVFSYRLKRYLNEKYLIEIYNSIQKDEYDIFFLIRGEIIDRNFLTKIKTKLLECKFFMYQWDSVENNPSYVNFIDMFDTVSTFDKVDAQKLGINYLPLFFTSTYSNKFQDNVSDKEYDLVFFGSAHGGRLSIIKQIVEIAKTSGIKFRYHLFITKFGIFRDLLLRKLTLSDIKYLKTYNMTSSEIVNAYSNTKAVLDIEHYGQNGLTIRTFEVLASGLRLITTNNHIKDEEFYTANSVQVLDRNNISIDVNFFNKKFDCDKIKNYSLELWLKKIIS